MIHQQDRFQQRLRTFAECSDRIDGIDFSPIQRREMGEQLAALRGLYGDILENWEMLTESSRLGAMRTIDEINSAFLGFSSSSLPDRDIQRTNLRSLVKLAPGRIGPIPLSAEIIRFPSPAPKQSPVVTPGLISGTTWTNRNSPTALGPSLPTSEPLTPQNDVRTALKIGLAATVVVSAIVYAAPHTTGVLLVVPAGTVLAFIHYYLRRAEHAFAVSCHRKSDSHDPNDAEHLAHTVHGAEHRDVRTDDVHTAAPFETRAAAGGVTWSLSQTSQHPSH